MDDSCSRLIGAQILDALGFVGARRSWFRSWCEWIQRTNALARNTVRARSRRSVRFVFGTRWTFSVPIESEPNAEHSEETLKNQAGGNASYTRISRVLEGIAGLISPLCRFAHWARCA